MNKNKLLLLISISLIFISSGCVDTGVENIPSEGINYTSMVRFNNQVPSDAAVAVSGTQVNVPTGTQSAYVEAPSGSRNVTATFPSGPNLSEPVALETDAMITITIEQDSTGARSFVKTIDGYK